MQDPDAAEGVGCTGGEVRCPDLFPATQWWVGRRSGVGARGTRRCRPAPSAPPRPQGIHRPGGTPNGQHTLPWVGIPRVRDTVQDCCRSTRGRTNWSSRGPLPTGTTDRAPVLLSMPLPRTCRMSATSPLCVWVQGPHAAHKLGDMMHTTPSSVREKNLNIDLYFFYHSILGC